MNMDELRDWLSTANGKKIEDTEPYWDINYERMIIDFDGPIVRVASRFYPPEKNTDDWKGSVYVLIGDKVLMGKEIAAMTLPLLQRLAENQVTDLKEFLLLAMEMYKRFHRQASL